MNSAPKLLSAAGRKYPGNCRLSPQKPTCPALPVVVLLSSMMPQILAEPCIVSTPQFPLQIKLKNPAHWNLVLEFLRRQPSDGSIEMKSMGVGLITEADDVYSSELDIRDGNRHLPRRESWLSHFSGWRGGFLSSITISTSVLLLNVILLILATTAWNPKQGIATSYTGDCDMAGRLTTVTHLFINVLSSLLLGASNYCMQRLVAPTRKEVDMAHAKKKWMDIGIPSVRNLFYINKWRVVLWLLLAASSVPLHLL